MEHSALLLELYKQAIEGRRTHYQNYEKWMTFYYVAVGAIFVAYYSVNKDANKTPVCIDLEALIPILGFVTSIFWHLSCKGYKYWSDNWIKVIYHFENMLVKHKELKVYQLFHEETFKNELQNNHLPHKSADLSTPKITLVFSFVVASMWLFVNLNMLICYFPDLRSCLRGILCLMVLSLFLTGFITGGLSKWSIWRNRVNSTHYLFRLPQDDTK